MELIRVSSQYGQCGVNKQGGKYELGREDYYVPQENFTYNTNLLSMKIAHDLKVRAEKGPTKGCLLSCSISFSYSTSFSTVLLLGMKRLGEIKREGWKKEDQ